MTLALFSAHNFTMKITVTKEDIKKGKPEQGESCPIARAIRRQTRKKVHVGYICLEINHCEYTFPQEAQQFVKDFDAGKPVGPFSFETKKINW